MGRDAPGSASHFRHLRAQRAARAEQDRLRTQAARELEQLRAQMYARRAATAPRPAA